MRCICVWETATLAEILTFALRSPFNRRATITALMECVRLLAAIRVGDVWRIFRKDAYARLACRTFASTMHVGELVSLHDRLHGTPADRPSKVSNQHVALGA